MKPQVVGIQGVLPGYGKQADRTRAPQADPTVGRNATCDGHNMVA